MKADLIRILGEGERAGRKCCAKIVVLVSHLFVHIFPNMSELYILISLHLASVYNYKLLELKIN